MESRRDFLKLFGVGAAIVPIIGGVPSLAAEAKIISPPKVELVDDLTTFGEIEGKTLKPGQYGITVIMEDANGKRSVIHGKTFLFNVGVETRDVHSRFNKSLRMKVIERERVTWNLSGEFISGDEGTLLTVSEFPK